MSLNSEIFEQPVRLSHLLLNEQKNVENIAAAIRKRKIRYVFSSCPRHIG